MTAETAGLDRTRAQGLTRDRDSTTQRALRLASPRWLHPRVVLGITLILGSLAAGAHVLAAADRTTAVFVSARELVPGERLRASDLDVVRVHLSASASRYVAAGAAPPVGYVVTRYVGARELLPVAALATAPSAPTRDVAVPVEPGHLPPDLTRGQRVDVYLTQKGSASQVPTLVLEGAAVVSRDGGARGFGGGSTVTVVLAVLATHVGALVHAVEAGAIDLVVVPPAEAAG